MSNVASLELCKELYELSGWKDTYLGYLRSRSLPVHTTKQAYEVPLYDLGYLLRKLPGDWSLVPAYEGEYSCAYFAEEFTLEGEGDTPEDAACKLCVELIKQGVITP